MSVTIKDVEKNSKFYKKGIRCGDTLVSVNSHKILDILDYDFYLATEKKCDFSFLLSNGKSKKINVKASDADGLCFETYLMDRQHHCKNKCIFCFIDQLPKGMRESLYFKDDDSRLSFLFGNYITLTNITEHEIERIIAMHISPVNISVHTMNPELRVKMMNNKNAGECLKIIKRLADANIKINTQLVLCPNINDGKELEFSLNELAKMYPAVQSIAAVPLGLTKHREGLYTLMPYTKEQAEQVIEIIEDFGNDFKSKNGVRLAFAADEFYLKAEKEMPDDDFYEDYPQLDNGVGLWTSLKTEFYDSLKNDDFKSPQNPTKITLATGVAAYPLMKEFAVALENRFKNLNIEVVAIKNNFFGETITVAGLLTGQDLIEQLKGKDLGKALFISSSMVKGSYPEETNGVFLDDVTQLDAEEKLKTKIIPLINDGKEMIMKILEVE